MVNVSNYRSSVQSPVAHENRWMCLCPCLCIFVCPSSILLYGNFIQANLFFSHTFFFITLQPMKRCISFFSLFNIEYKFKFQIQIYQYKNANLIRIIKCFHCHQFYASQFLNYTRYVSFSLSFFFFAIQNERF